MTKRNTKRPARKQVAKKKKRVRVTQSTPQANVMAQAKANTPKKSNKKIDKIFSEPTYTCFELTNFTTGGIEIGIDIIDKTPSEIEAEKKCVKVVIEVSKKKAIGMQLALRNKKSNVKAHPFITIPAEFIIHNTIDDVFDVVWRNIMFGRNMNHQLNEKMKEFGNDFEQFKKDKKK